MSLLTKFTIITVSLNSEKYIEDAINSVLNQDYNNIEYWIIDGQSTDNTLKIIEKYYSKYKGKLKYLSEKDNGIYDAINKGIAISKGEIIGILNSDDWYEDNVISYVASKISDYDMLHGNMRIIDNNNLQLKIYGPRNKKYWRYISTPFNHPTMFVKRYVYNKIGTYNNRYSTAADYDFMLRLISSKFNEIYVDRTITNIRPVGITTSIRKVVNPSQIFLILKKNDVSIFTAYIYMTIRYLREIVAKLIITEKLRKKINNMLFYHR